MQLRYSKTGQKIVQVGKSAPAIVASLPRVLDSGLVSPADKLGRRGAERTLSGHRSIWYRVRAKAGLPQVRLHDFRHTAASIAVANGASLPMVARILGHADAKTTQRTPTSRTHRFAKSSRDSPTRWPAPCALRVQDSSS